MPGTTRRARVDGRDFGQVLVSRGLLTADELEECFRAQSEAVEASQPVPSLEDLIVQRGYLSRPQVEDARMALRGKVRFCARCETPVYIPVAGPAGERCPSCREGLEWREERRDVRVDDTSKLLTATELPVEVGEAAKDPARRFGKYVLVEQIGRGGAAVVHKAWDTYLGQYVALKFIKPRANVPLDTVQARHEHESRILDLLKEARNTIRLRHPNIVPVFDAGRIGREFYISMEFVEGNTMAEHLAASQTRGVLSPLYEDPRAVIGQLREIARAVHFAHTREMPIMHCDIKPGNVIIDLSGRPFILDFGLATELRDAAEEVEGQGLVRGTPAYMSPEQAMGKQEEVDPRTDVYALGAILYELIAGKPPFWGNVLEILRAVVTTPPMPPLQVNEGRPLPAAGRLQEIALQCLEKEKDARFRTAQELAEELQKVLTLLEGNPLRGRVVRDPFHNHPLPHLVEQQRRLDGLTGTFNTESARRGFRELASATTDAAVRQWAEACLVEVGWIETLKRQMVQRLNRHRPILPTLDLLERTLENVEVLKTTEKKLVLYAGDRAIEVPWAGLKAAQIVAIAQGTCSLNAPQDRLSLGIYCLKAGLLAEARQEFTALLGTELDDNARQYLATLGE